MRTLLGNGQTNTKVYSKNLKCLSLLKQNYQYQIQNILFHYASFIGLGAVLFQLNEQNKMKVISYNSRILNPQEQKLSTLDRELLGTVHALQIDEFLIIGSPHPIHIFTDHKPLLHCFTKKSNLSPRFYRAQMQLTKIFKTQNNSYSWKKISLLPIC